MSGHIEFGYPWWLSYGHLVVAVPLLFLCVFGYLRRWRKLPMLLLCVIALWASAAFLVARFVLNFNGPASLPTQNFLASGTGRVLDLGAGTGRSSIMVLGERPRATLVALDLFSESYDRHFGHGTDPQVRLLSNLKAARVDSRATIQPGDMRRLPFEPASFDAIVSAYAIDHLRREGIEQSLAEAARVVRPGGDFLLMLIGKEPWLQFAFGPLLLHGGPRPADWWSKQLEAAGFRVLESGMRPGTLYLLSRKP